MNSPPGLQPRQRRYSVRQQACLDAESHAKLEHPARTFHRSAAILRYVMQWGLGHKEGWTSDPLIPDRLHLVHMLVEPDLLQHVQEAADAHRASVAAWVSHAMRQVTPADFPASWHAGDIATRSHDFGYDDRKFGLRLDEVTS